MVGSSACDSLLGNSGDVGRCGTAGDKEGDGDKEIAESEFDGEDEEAS